jgi:zinc protease
MNHKPGVHMFSCPFKNYRFVLTSFLTAVVITSVAWSSSPALAFVDHGKVVSRTLPNGLEVLVREEPAQKVVELQVWVGVGSRDEPDGKEGIAHLFEHMLFKGTKKRGVGEIARTVEAAGGDINAYTSTEHTVYHITIAVEFFVTAMDILADAVTNPTFDEEELEREKLVVIEEIHRGNDNPARVFSRELFNTAYEIHPYGRTVIGTPESVGSISRTDMIRFHKAWYHPQNMKLVVVGGVRADEVFESAKRFFMIRGNGRAQRREVVEPPQEQMRIFRLTMDSEPARLFMAFPIGILTDPETPVLDLIAAVLSGGRSARLQVELRDIGLVHSAWSYAYTPADPGLFIIGATMSQDQVQDAFQGILEQIVRLQSNPVNRDELDRAREQILSEKIFSKETVEGQAREIGYLALTLGDLDFNDRYYSRLQSVNPRDIMEAARRIFRPEKATVGFLTENEYSQPDSEDLNRMLQERLKPDQKQQKADVAPVYKSELPNGIVLLVREDHRLPLVAARVGVLGGVRYETEENQGAFNLLAHLLTRGTRVRTALQMAERLDSMSASLGGFSGRNSFGLTGRFLSDDIEEGFELMREVLTEAILPREELELSRQRIISAIRARRDDLTSLALDLFQRTLFKEHPYRFPVTGTEESLASFGREELLSILRAVVQPKGMVISVAGDITVRDAYRIAERHFGDLAGDSYDPGPLPVEVAKEEGIDSDRIRREEKTQTHVILGYPGPSMDSQDLDSLEVLNGILAGQGGRLFTELRDRQGLAYSVFSFVAPGVDPGFIAFGIGVSPEREAEAIDGFLEQINRVRDEPVPVEELERAKRYIIGSRVIGLQTLQSRVDEVFFPTLYGQDLDRALAFRGRMLSITPEQVREAARKYFHPEHYVLAVVEGGARETQD